jgi:hypothetical protein
MRIIKTTAILVSAGFLLGGCLKSKSTNFANDKASPPNVVDFNNQSEVASFDIVPGATIYTFYAELSSSDKSYPAGSVTITKTPSIVTAAGYEFLPDSAYQLVAITSNIDPVTHLVPFQLRIFTSKIDLTHSFAVGYTITSVSNGAKIAENKKTTIIAIVAMNQYEGDYHKNGYFYHPAAGSSRPISNLSVYVATAGPNSVTTNLGDLGNQITITVDANNNLTVADATGISPGIGPTVVLASLAAGSPPLYSPFPGSNPAIYTNKYNPATKTFYLRYGYLGGTGWRDIEEVIVRD